MTDTTRDNLVFIVALLSLLVFTCGAALFVAGLRMLRQDKPKAAPRATRHNPTLTDKALSHAVPRAPDPAIVIPPIDVVFRPGQVKPDYGDATEIRTRVIEESPYARWRRHG